MRTRRGHTGVCGDTGEASQHEQPQSSDRTALNPALVCRSRQLRLRFLFCLRPTRCFRLSPCPFLPPHASASAATRRCQSMLSRHRVTFSCQIGRMKDVCIRAASAHSLTPRYSTDCTPVQPTPDDHTCEPARVLSWQRTGWARPKLDVGVGGRSTSDHKIRFSRSSGQP